MLRLTRCIQRKKASTDCKKGSRVKISFSCHRRTKQLNVNGFKGNKNTFYPVASLKRRKHHKSTSGLRALRSAQNGFHRKHPSCVLNARYLFTTPPTSLNDDFALIAAVNPHGVPSRAGTTGIRQRGEQRSNGGRRKNTQRSYPWKQKNTFTLTRYDTPGNSADSQKKTRITIFLITTELLRNELRLLIIYLFWYNMNKVYLKFILNSYEHFALIMQPSHLF